MESKKLFNTEAGKIADDTFRQEIFDDNISNYDISVSKAKRQYQNLELAIKRAGYIRYKSINSLEKYLIEFEANFERNGGKILWALDAEEALREFQNILKRHKTSKVLISKSLISDEIGMDEFLIKENVKSKRLNPAEWVQKLLGEKPRHSFSFLIEKSLDQIVDVVTENSKTAFKRDSKQILDYIRTENEKEIESGCITVSAANFLIADTGSICLSENSGDGTICNSVAGVSIVLAGIDKILPSFKNLQTLLPLYSSYTSGDQFHAYNSIIQGPGFDGEKDGPSELYLILIDNGRSDVLAKKEQRRALGCIDCGACQNACPVFRKAGGKVYDSPYTGPIGSVLNPWMYDFEQHIHQSYASTLCGRCTEVCPVGIDIHRLLLNNRNDSVNMKTHKMSENIQMDTWHFILKNRKWMDKANFRWKNRLLKKLYGEKWGPNKEMPAISEKSFKQLWEERREGKG